MPFKESSWRRREIRRTGHPIIEWLFIGTLVTPEISIGVLRDGSWVVDTPDGLADLQDPNALVFLFPILKLSTECVRVQLEELRSKTRGLACEEFPIRQVVIQAIVYGGYWAELAFNWLPEINLTSTEKNKILKGLSSIESSNDYNQKLRHKARKLRLSIKKNGV